MNVDERIRATLTIEAGSVSPPSVDPRVLRDKAGRVRRRRRAAVVAGAAAAVAAAVGIGAALVPHPASAPSPAPRPGPSQVRIGPPPRDAVWYDADGLHHGTDVYAVPGTAAPISISLVRGGAVYLVPSTLRVRYQPWHGSARDIGHGSREANWLLGPGADPDGTTAAWFDGPELVMYDTARGVEIARVAEPGRRVMPYYENEFGTRFHYVDQSRVVWDGRDGRVLMFDRATGRTTTLSASAAQAKASRVVDWSPGLRARSADDEAHPAVLTRAGTVLYTGADGSGPVRFSPDGRYLVALDRADGSSDAAAPVVVDTGDGSYARLATAADGASVGWGYGHTLMYLQSGGISAFDEPAPLLVYDAAMHRLVAVRHRGEAILPAS